MTTGDDRGHQPERIDRRRLALALGWTMLGLVACLFLPAGTWAWSRGWLFVSVLIAPSVVATLYLRRVNPDVIAARVNRREGTKRWDRVLVGILFPATIAI